MSEIKIRCSYDKLISLEDAIKKASPKNPNRHSGDQIRRLGKILEYQGIRRPIRISNLSGYITAGHGLVLALAALGKSTKVPANFQDYESEDQENQDLISDNAIAHWSELDFSLINEMTADFSPDFSIDLLGIKDFQVEVADRPKRVCQKCGHNPEECS